MSGKSNRRTTLLPVSRGAAERAFPRVFGSPVTHPATYQRFQEGLYARQRELFRGLGQLATIRQAFGGADFIPELPYIAGGFGFWAAVEAHAKMNKLGTPSVRQHTINNALIADIALGGGAEAFNSGLHVLDAHLPQGIVRAVRTSSFERFLGLIDDFEPDMLAFDPHSAENAAVFKQFGDSVRLAMGTRYAAFSEQEAEFSGVMRKWWSHHDPRVQYAELAGAADVRLLVELQQAETAPSA